MRILMVSNLWPPEVVGGAEQYASALSDHLRAAGHEVHVLTLGVEGPDVVRAVTPWPYPIQETPAQPTYKRLAFHAVDLYNPTRRARARRGARRAGTRRRAHECGAGPLERRAHPAGPTRGVAHVHTLHDYWLLCQRNSMVHRDGRQCEPRCRSCVGISWIRNEAIRRSPPGVVLAVSQAIAAEHEQLAWTQSRMRVLYNPVEIVAGSRVTPRGAAVHSRSASSGGSGSTRASARCSRRSRRGAWVTRSSWSRVGARSKRTCARAGPGPSIAAGWVDQDRKDGAARRGGLPGGAVAVEGPGAGRAERGAGPGHPGHRRRDRWHPGAHRARVPAAPVPARGRRGPGGAARDLRPRRPSATARCPAAAPIDWAGHVDAVLAAYAEARPAGSGTTRRDPDHGAWPQAAAAAPKITRWEWVRTRCVAGCGRARRGDPRARPSRPRRVGRAAPAATPSG